MIDILYENIQWVFSGVGVPLLIYFLFGKRKEDKPQKVEVREPEKLIIENTEQELSFEEQEDNYRTSIGKQHQWLRADVLGIKLRDMALFYSLETVSELEAYERGERELPLDLITKLESFFFIRKDVLDGDSRFIFRNFHLCYESLEQLLSEGFSPTIACCPTERHDLYCFIVMHKEENGFMRIVVSDLVGSFASNGGGRMNIEYLISVMINRNISCYDIPILTTTKEDWEKLQSDTYYDPKLFHRLGAADRDCMDVFYSWYDTMVEVRSRRNGTSQSI
ncbi:hypothetical protein ACE02D_15230 [Shewanella bicestrii]